MRLPGIGGADCCGAPCANGGGYIQSRLFVKRTVAVARRTKEEAAVTREQLLDAAERVFRERGVAGSTLAEVAAAAGVTRGAVYWHFRDKADLYAAMCERATLPLETMVEDAGATVHADPMAALRELALTALLAACRRSAIAGGVRGDVPQMRARRRVGAASPRASSASAGIASFTSSACSSRPCARGSFRRIPIRRSRRRRCMPTSPASCTRGCSIAPPSIWPGGRPRSST